MRPALACHARRRQRPVGQKRGVSGPNHRRDEPPRCRPPGPCHGPSRPGFRSEQGCRGRRQVPARPDRGRPTSRPLPDCDQIPFLAEVAATSEEDEVLSLALRLRAYAVASTSSCAGSRPGRRAPAGQGSPARGSFRRRRRRPWRPPVSGDRPSPPCRPR